MSEYELPAKFESVEALIQAYQHAERKIGQQGTELNQLRAALAEAEAGETVTIPIEEFGEGADISQYEDGFVETMQSLAAQSDGGNLQSRVARAKAMLDAAEQQESRAQALSERTAGIEAAFQNPQAMWNLIGPPALELVKQQVPNWNEREVMEAIQAQPELLHTAFASGDASELARAIVNINSVIEAGKPPAYDATAAKRAAQTLSGTSPRPAEAQDDPWQKIVNAGAGSYERLMRGK